MNATDVERPMQALLDHLDLLAKHDRAQLMKV